MVTVPARLLSPPNLRLEALRNMSSCVFKNHLWKVCSVTNCQSFYIQGRKNSHQVVCNTTITAQHLQISICQT